MTRRKGTDLVIESNKMPSLCAATKPAASAYDLQYGKGNVSNQYT